ncbi:ornithine cyclodeaminase family protein [Corynebacterium auriscanis]|uniref:ornithine cyclodeaminase family protein n=1 Tax=Corynebacterium auriscanis TaxID=99807 RepID=UPI003CE8BF03
MQFLSYDDVNSAITPAKAVEALRQVLRSGYDPVDDQARTKVPLHHGEMHLLPSTLPHVAGVKIILLHPQGFDTDLPLIQGQYLLADGETLTPHTLLDGAALTTLRTPAVSLAGIRDFIVDGSDPINVVILGAGAQGRGHAETVTSVLEGIREVSIAFVSRNEPDDLGYTWLRSGSAEAAEALKAADLVLCATTAASPIVQLEDVSAHAVIVAVGSHTTDARELSADLVGAAHVIVEEPTAALAEAGDITLAIEDGTLSESDLVSMKDVVSGAVQLERDRPIVFKTVGMPWEDLVVAEAVWKAHDSRGE